MSNYSAVKFSSIKPNVFFYFFKETGINKENKDCIVVMSKENNKWKVVEEIDAYYLIN